MASETWSAPIACCLVASVISCTEPIVCLIVSVTPSKVSPAWKICLTPSSTPLFPSSTAWMVVWVALWISWMIAPICWAAFWLWSASFLTSVATTANPLPCSPARAASMAAFNASMLDGRLGGGLDLLDDRAGLLGRFLALVGELPYFGGDDGEPLAVLAGSGRFDGGV